MAIRVQTTEVHLLKNNSTDIDNADFFEFIVINKDIDVTSNCTFRNTSNLSINDVIEFDTSTPKPNKIIAKKLGTTYLEIKLNNEKLIVKVSVHSDISKTTNEYIFTPNFSRLTIYKSRYSDKIEENLVVSLPSQDSVL